MTSSTSDWNLYRSFLGVLDSGSLSRAARQLGLSQPTVGRHVDTLEESLGVSLFTRGPSGLIPTDTALALAPQARAMAAAAQAMRRTATGGDADPAGTVRVTASEAIGSEVLPSILAPFRARYPRIGLELALSDRMSDLLAREADIAVRMQRPTQGNVVARRLGTVRIGLYAHRDYVERHGEPASLDELPAHSGIGYDRETWLYRTLGSDTPLPDPAAFDFRTDYYAAQSAALRAGLGIGGMQQPIARRYPELVPVLSDAFDVRLEMWLAMHEDLRGMPHVRALFDHLARALADFCTEDSDRPRDGDGQDAPGA
ncbi:LysR family transcriptional regulator [Ectothiorhodospiraceae bacterium WFHF3C12]|nr:LysR family transcriptional regulator [Ectothiorhodospiraceae bacterium WFHF3C12]